MRIHEYQAKEIFARYGIAVPENRLAASGEEAWKATADLDGRAVLKAQIHAGGRGHGGGVKVVNSPDEARQVADALLAERLVTPQTGPEGAPVHHVLVEALADIARELYLAITIDRVARSPVLLASPAGGMDIEEVAATRPQDIHNEVIDPVMGFMPFQARRLTAKLGLEGAQAQACAGVMGNLCRIFADNDCSLVEINPLVVTGGGDLVALDAKINLDDDSLFRHRDLLKLQDKSQEDELEVRAADMDIAYVNLDGEVGCLVNGAGLAMATLDVANAAGAAPGQLSGRGRRRNRREGGQRGLDHTVRSQGHAGAGQHFRWYTPVRCSCQGCRSSVPANGFQPSVGGAAVGHQRRRGSQHPAGIGAAGHFRQHSVGGGSCHPAVPLNFSPETLSFALWGEGKN